MSKQLEEKIIRLIDDYLKNGLRVYVGSTMKDGRHWISFADSAEAPLIKALFEIADSIYRTESIGTDIGSAIENLSDKRRNDADWNADEALIHEDDGVEVYAHPISAIAEALFEIARKKT